MILPDKQIGSFPQSLWTYYEGLWEEVHELKGMDQFCDTLPADKRDAELWAKADRRRDVYFRTGEFVDEYEHARHDELPDNV